MGGKDDPMSDVVFIGDDEEDSGSASISISTENERGDTCAFRNSGATSSEMARSSDGWGDLFLDEVGIQEEEEEEEENQRFRQRRYGDPHDSGPERVFIVGVGKKGGPEDAALEYDIEESLGELAQLADTAGLRVVGSMHQRLDRPDPGTYIGRGKLEELKMHLRETEADTVVFDDELAPKQSKKLEQEMKKFPRRNWREGEEEGVRVADRTELILDIFNQRATTKEARLQVEMAQLQYQLPRLRKMWTHLEREKQSGKGTQRGMGEKQIEVDKRQIKSQMSRLRGKIDDVRKRRRQHRRRREKNQIPIVSCVGYTNAGKSTLLNGISSARVHTEDKLFATLDPTTRRVALPSGSEVLMTDTVGFIQKLPTQLVAAFRATLEEIMEAHLIIHVVDVSHPNAPAQVEAANRVLEEVGATDIPQLLVWNKLDNCEDPTWVQGLANSANSACVSAKTGEGIPQLRSMIEDELRNRFVRVYARIPWREGELYDEVSRVGVIERTDFEFEGIRLQASVPPFISKRLSSYRLKE